MLRWSFDECSMVVRWMFEGSSKEFGFFLFSSNLGCPPAHRAIPGFCILHSPLYPYRPVRQCKHPCPQAAAARSNCRTTTMTQRHAQSPIPDFGDSAPPKNQSDSVSDRPKTETSP